MNKKSIYKAIIAIAVALAFVLPGSAVFANVSTIGVTSNSETASNVENVVEIIRDTDDIEDGDFDDTEVAIEEMDPNALDLEIPVSTIEPITDDIRPDGNPRVLSGNTIYVDDNRPSEWYNETQVRTIQEGIDNANAGDTVYVYNGMYNVVYPGIIVYKSVDLIGESRENVIIDGIEVVTYNIQVTANNVTINNFTVRDGSQGIWLRSVSNVTVMNCDVYNFLEAWYGNAIQLDFSSHCKIINCITNKTSSGTFGGNGIYLILSSDNEIIDCTSYDNDFHAIWLEEYSNNNKIINCIGYDSTVFTGWASGIYLRKSAGNIITDSTFYNNLYGIFIQNSPNNVLTGNTVYGNYDCDFTIEGQTISDYEQTIDGSNTVDGKPIYYLTGESNFVFNESYTIGYLGLVSCINITVTNVDLSGAIVVNTTSSTFSDVRIYNGRRGLSFLFSYDNEVVNAECYDNYDGIYIAYCSGITVTGGEYYNNMDGICVYESTDTVITDGDYHDNMFGIFSWDGSSHTSITNCLAHNSSQHGVYIQGNNLYSTVTDCTVYNNVHFGFYIGYNNLNVVALNNTVYGNNYGFKIANSVDSFLQNNIIYDNVYNFDLSGYTLEQFHHDIDSSNIINEKPIYYLVEADDFLMEETCDAGYLAFISSTNVTLRNLDIPGIGLLFAGTTNSTIENVSFYNNIIGLYLWGSSYNNITNCVFYNNTKHALFLSGSDDISSNNNTIAGCNIYHNNLIAYSRTIYLYKSENNLITDCDIHDNGGNIYLLRAPHNQFINCNVYNNTCGYSQLYVSTYSNYIDIQSCNVYNNSRDGVRLYGSAYANIVDSTFSNHAESGVELIGPENNVINCTFIDNKHGGILLNGASNNIIMGNTMVNNAISISGTSVTYWIHTIDSMNTVNEKPIYYYKNQVGGSVPLGAGQVILVNCENMLVENQNCIGISIGFSSNIEIKDCNVSGYVGEYGYIIRSMGAICLYQSSGITITNCVVHDNVCGIYIYKGAYIDIVDCELYGNQYGTYLYYFEDSNIKNCDVHDNVNGIYSFIVLEGRNNIENCTAYDNEYGIHLRNGANNIVTNCDVHDNKYGIYIWGWYAHYNQIYSNNVYNNEYGIYIDHNSLRMPIGTVIYHNTIGDNDVNAYGAVRPFFEEDFESEFADCIVIDGGEDNNTWNNTNPGGRTPAGGCDGTFMIVDSDYAGPGVTMDEELISFSMDFSTVSEVILNFGQYYKHHSGSSGCVDVSTDGGSTWTNVATYVATEYGPTAIDISSIAAGHSEVKVRWAYSDSGNQAYYWMVDNINILADTNHWDDGNKGNFWSDYTGVDVDPEDGIGDTPYDITGGINQDRYPLMVPLVDTMPPMITNVDADPSIQMSGDPVNITCTVTDYTLVDTVIASITTPSQSTSADEFTMANIPGTDDYYCNVVYIETGTYDYSILANDTSENDAVSDVYQFEITDIDLIPPVISNVVLATSDPLDTDAPYGWENIVCIVTDNIAVRDVKLNVTIDTTTVEYIMTETATDTYECNITITPHGIYTYHVWADDIGGNNATSTDEAFELPPNWDVSMNGETYIEDFVRVAGWYGVTGPNGGWIREDVSNNGEVYIEDFVIIAGHYGERWKPI